MAELQNREPQEDIDDNFGAVDLGELSGATPASTSSYCARGISMPSSVSHSYAEHNIPPISAVAARRMLPPYCPLATTVCFIFLFVSTNRYIMSAYFEKFVAM
jgi:hypothetical protein